MEEGSWYSEALANPPKLPKDKKYQLLAAKERDKQVVREFYSRHPVAGYGIASIQVIHNPAFSRKFDLGLDQLQEREGNNAFMPKWDKTGNIKEREQRQGIMMKWRAMTVNYRDPRYPAVSLLPAWHGTREEVLDSIFRTGYSNLSFTDEGFFGKGLYSAFEAEYAYRVYSRGKNKPLILNWVASFSAFPVIASDELNGKANYGNYDAHFVPVCRENPNSTDESTYRACHPGEQAEYHEIVVFQQDNCLPRYLVYLQKTLLKTLSVSNYSADLGNNLGFMSQPDYPAEEKSTIENMSALATFLPDYPAEEEPMPILSLPKGRELIAQGDYVAALACFEEIALKSQETVAYVYLAWLHDRVIYPKEPKKVSDYYQKAYQKVEYFRNYAKQGEVTAQYELGLLLMSRPNQTLEKIREGIDNYRSAARKQHTAAQYELGCCYQNNKVEALSLQDAKDFAVKCYTASADGCDPLGCYQLGMCYEQGYGVPQDMEKAFMLYKASADKGYALAQNKVGLCYEEGKGVYKNYSLAVDYYMRAADQKYVIAQYNLGLAFHTGRLGLVVDYTKAIQYYQDSVAQNYMRSQYGLADFYKNGLGGLPIDHEQAARYYHLAAEQGYGRAQWNLAFCYENGQGVKENLAEAKRYYQLAMANSTSHAEVKQLAQQALKRLEAKRETVSLKQNGTPFWSPQPYSTPINLAKQSVDTQPKNQPF